MIMGFIIIVILIVFYVPAILVLAFAYVGIAYKTIKNLDELSVGLLLKYILVSIISIIGMFIPVVNWMVIEELDLYDKSRLPIILDKISSIKLWKKKIKKQEYKEN